MDMNKTFYLSTDQCEKNRVWHVIDATDKVVGRLATEIADLLRGRGKVEFANHTDCGDYVVVVNAEKVVFTGDKMTGKEYVWYTGWRSGQRRATPTQKMARDVEYVINAAVDGMLPKNKLARQQIKRLNIYAGPQHPHAAQVGKQVEAKA